MARITNLTIETERLTARVMVAEDNERDYILGWKSGTSMLRMTEDDMTALAGELSEIRVAAKVTLIGSQPTAEERKMLGMGVKDEELVF